MTPDEGMTWARLLIEEPLTESHVLAGLERIKTYLTEQGYTRPCDACPDAVIRPDQIDVWDLWRAFLDL